MPASPPLITVILPVYNGGPYLNEAIVSILNQTLTDLELIIIDDCSTDDSLAVAQRHAASDARVQVLVNDRNRGRAHSDNRGHALARGRYIAKMDADDVALPHRLQTQVNFLESRPDITLTSSYLDTFGATQTRYKYPISPDAVRGFLLFNMPVGNPTVFFRRELVAEHKLDYDEKIIDTFGEDYEWVARVVQIVAIENQPQVLLRYRTFPASIKADVHARRTAKSNLIREKVLAQAGFVASTRELHVHNTIAHYPFLLGDITLAEVDAWLGNLLAQNEQLHYVSSAVWRQLLAERWFMTCYQNPDRTINNFRAYRNGHLAAAYRPELHLRLKLWLKNNVLRHIPGAHY